MAFSTSSCFFTSPNLTVNQPPSPSRFVSYSKAKSFLILANFATAERTTSNTTRSTRISSPSLLYEVPGIQIGADTTEIKEVYRRLGKVLHPDVGNHDSSADEFMKVHSTYAMFSDPGKRGDYDRDLFVRYELCSLVLYSSFSQNSLFLSPDKFQNKNNFHNHQ